jgi:hypothetical protein
LDIRWDGGKRGAIKVEKTGRVVVDIELKPGDGKRGRAKKGRRVFANCMRT